MEIRLHHWTGGTRPCRFSLCVENETGVVFADFDVADGRVYLVRISFDGFGCCDPTERIEMDEADSKARLELVGWGNVAGADYLLRRYFRRAKATLWQDALEHHHLL